MYFSIVFQAPGLLNRFRYAFCGHCSQLTPLTIACFFTMRQRESLSPRHSKGMSLWDVAAQLMTLDLDIYLVRKQIHIAAMYTYKDMGLLTLIFAVCLRYHPWFCIDTAPLNSLQAQICFPSLTDLQDTAC